jgi:hypothetical protein
LLVVTSLPELLFNSSTFGTLCFNVFFSDSQVNL